MLRAVKATEAEGPAPRGSARTPRPGSPCGLERPAGHTPLSMCVSEASGTDPWALNLVCRVSAHWSRHPALLFTHPSELRTRDRPTAPDGPKGGPTSWRGGCRALIWPLPVAHPHSARPSHQSPAGLAVADPTHSPSQDPQQVLRGDGLGDFEK